MAFPYNEYGKWIKFREQTIYDFLIPIYTDTNPPSNDPDKEDKKEFIENIWKNVELINYGLNSNELDYLLFTHLFILNSEFILPDLYNSYGLSDKFITPLSYISSASDGSTSVSSTNMGIEDIGLDGTMYMFTKWGYLYLTLLKQLQSLVVIL